MKPIPAAATGGRSDAVTNEVALSFCDTVTEPSDPDLFQACLDQFSNWHFSGRGNDQVGQAEEANPKPFKEASINCPVRVQKQTPPRQSIDVCSVPAAGIHPNPSLPLSVENTSAL